MASEAHIKNLGDPEGCEEFRQTIVGFAEVMDKAEKQKKQQYKTMRDCLNLFEKAEERRRKRIQEHKDDNERRAEIAQKMREYQFQLAEELTEIGKKLAMISDKPVYVRKTKKMVPSAIAGFPD